MTPRPTLLATGVSARALASAAARAGWDPIVLDAYGDRDCVGTVHPVSPFTPRRAAHAAQRLRYDAIAPASGWEHAPAIFARLGAGAAVLGASAAAMRAARDPITVARALRRAGLPSLVTASGARSSPPLRSLTAPARSAVRAWRGSAPLGAASAWEALDKPRRSGGGRGIVRLTQGERGGAGRYLQEWRDGVPVSLIVAANGTAGVPLALTEQWSGMTALHASGFAYAGSLLAGGSAELAPLPLHDAHARSALATLADVLVRATGLCGLVGVDGILDDDGVFWLVEVNPRWCASFELLDRLLPTPLFTLHERACRGMLPTAWLTADARTGVSGKAIVYHDARLPAVPAPDLGGERSAEHLVADIPHIGTLLQPGGPICTVLATGLTAPEVRQRLLDGAHHVTAQLSLGRV